MVTASMGQSALSSTVCPYLEWAPMPDTARSLRDAALAFRGAQIRARHRARMRLRWRVPELRAIDAAAKRLPEDWHEWMQCPAGEYGLYDCVCDEDSRQERWPYLQPRAYKILPDRPRVPQSEQLQVVAQRYRAQEVVDNRKTRVQRHSRQHAITHQSHPTAHRIVDRTGIRIVADGTIRFDFQRHISTGIAGRPARSLGGQRPQTQRRVCLSLGTGRVRRAMLAVQ
jgi:hypothetical protein